MNPASFGRRAGLPAGIVIGLMAVGNAVSAYSAAGSGLELCRREAERSTGEGAMNVAGYSFARGVFSQTMEVRLVSGWVDPAAEVTVTVDRPVFFMPWRVSSQETRVAPEAIVSL